MSSKSPKNINNVRQSPTNFLTVDYQAQLSKEDAKQINLRIPSNVPLNAAFSSCDYILKI